jgi:hypothetical protein
MADTNITELRLSPLVGEVSRKAKDPTAALRAKRARKKRKTVTVPVKPEHHTGLEKTNEIKSNVTVRHGGSVTVCTMVAALALATVSAGFSITGMTAVFVGATVPVIAMGIALELGKLSAVACLGRRYGSAPLRAALIILITVLMGMNAIGAYGFLAKAHIGHQVEGDVLAAGRSADADARISVQTGVLADLDRRIAQIDSAVEKATSKGRTGSAMALADQQRKTRADLVAERTGQARALASLQVEKASIEGERRKVEADLRPVRYLANLVGAGDQDVLRYFILVVALLLDPAAVLLLLAAASARR